MKTLLDIKKPDQLRIIEINGGRGVLKHLAQLGIGVNSIISVDRFAPFSGPIMIKHEGSKFAIGVGIAAKIKVEAV